MNKLNVLAGVLGLLAALLVSPALLAHNSLASSVPADGASLAQAPGTLELTFSESTYLVAVELSRDGEPIDLDFEPPLDYSPHFVVPLPDLRPGDYTAHWEVEGMDTHTLTGDIDFSVSPDD